ncbi:MAG: hypothetical protein GWN67_17985, partial [Phycisphaerae bacterium]|nr:hypothetical protein [Gammaproteobacteria bacterium]NIS52983.1 hypothetical protein [Phycisphaerae bacterium]NIU10447.1 hypothetical protein [Phycisphaerae bacterium]NIU58201.1 hypothetical protein [Phycisphaerae bacterium]NIW94498.1 hypothetical protein [Phycisphaerae bacterium]
MPRSVKTSLLTLILISFLAGSTFGYLPLTGDFNKDYRVDVKDLRTFAWQWLHPGCFVPGCVADIDSADGVNMVDFALMSNNWQIEEPHLLISEFMASSAPILPLDPNELLDGDGQSSDWIEIYNPTGATVSLDGWHMTDNEDKLDKWRFPDGIEIKPGEFLIIFASNKTYAENPSNYPYLDPGGYYHTNFELNAGGEYLALVAPVAPDSNVVIHEYAPAFPQQLLNISYGLTQYATKLVSQGASVSYHVPTSGDSGLGTGWTAAGYDDSTWITEKTGLGFGIGQQPTVAYNDSHRGSGDFTAENVTNWTIHNNDSSNASGKLKNFATGSDAGMPTVTFTMGPEGLAVSSNAGANPAPGTDAYEIFNNIVDLSGPLVYYGSTGWWVDIAFTELNPASKYSFVGTAIRASNYPLRESLFTIMGHQGAVNNSSPGVVSKTNDTTVLLAGDNSITGYVVRWDDIVPAPDGSFKIRAEATAGSDQGKAYPLGAFMLEGGGSDSQVQAEMQNVNASLWTRIDFHVEDPTYYDTLTLMMRYEDGFVAYINGEEVARRNAPSLVEWNSTADSNRPNADSFVFEAINLMAYMHTLQAGNNVLAIHGLNEDKDDGNFLILPELIAARNRPVPQYFTQATPKTFNATGAIDVVEEVWFSHKRGFYDTPFELLLSNGTKDAVIRYTKDGSLPTITHGFTYNYGVDPPINIGTTTSIRAVAVKPGWLDSKVETHTYIFLDDVIQQPTNPPGFPTSGWGYVGPDYEMDPEVTLSYSSTIKNDMKAVPTLSLVMDVNDWFKTGGQGIYPQGERSERGVSAEWILPSGEEGFQIDCAVQIVGGSSVNRWKMDKLSMRLKFKGEWGPTELRYPVFGDEATDQFDTLVVDARMNNSWAYGGGVGINRPGLGQRDVAQYTRDQFASDIQNAMGGYGGKGRHVHLYLNGLYWGLYWLHERPDEHFAASYFGGDDDDYDVLKHNSNTAIHGTDDNYDEMFGVAGGGLSSDSQYQFLQTYLDVPGLIDYMLMNFYIGNTDWAHHNWYATRSRLDPAGRWRYHSWDAEHCMEGIGDNVVGKNNGGAPSGLHQLLRQNAEYNMLFADHIHRHFFNDGCLTPAGAAALYDVRLNDVDRAVVGESARWGDNHRTTPYTRDIEWITERNWLQGTYFPQRTNILLTQMASLYPDVNAPVFHINGSYQHGGEITAGDELTMVSTAPNIYYTTNGSDPREYLTGNAVGTPYSPITLSKSAHVKARSRNGATWSALNEAIYSVGPLVENLRITEIMYHSRNDGALTDPNEEFVELKNIGASTLNLNLVKFTEGIHFTFPDMELDPGECVVVVEDQAAFEARYGTGINTAGQYVGSLANNGERIKLVDPIGRTISDFNYKDGWYPIADGDGFSLTIIEPSDSAVYGLEGLVAHWKFDEISGSTATDSAGTNNGALIGPPTWTSGRLDGALSFDGAGDYVVFAPVGPLASDTFTAQAWVRLDASAGPWNPVLMQNTSVGNYGFFFYISNKRPDVYIFGSSGFVQASSPETINANQWYHVAITNNGSELKLYVDNQLKDSETSTGFTGVNQNAYVGYEPIASTYYKGLIDDVRIHDRAISESEFKDLADPTRRWSQKSSWRTSLYRYGTPGADDSGRLPNPGDIVINEVMAHSNAGPDWIELHNNTDETINIGGWFLSDNDRDEPNLTKYRIADGTTIGGNDYLIFYQDKDFNNPGNPGCNVPFALSENGEEACLSSYLDPNGFLTGYRDV